MMMMMIICKQQERSMCATMTVSLLRHNSDYGGYSQGQQQVCHQAAVEDRQ